MDRFVDVEAAEAGAEEFEDEIDVNLGACAFKVFVLNLTHLCRLIHR
jgi:hypothetical protein